MRSSSSSSTFRRSFAITENGGNAHSTSVLGEEIGVEGVRVEPEADVAGTLTIGRRGEAIQRVRAPFLVGQGKEGRVELRLAQVRLHSRQPVR